MLSTEAKLSEKTFSANILSQPKARELADIAEEFSLGEPFSAAGLHRESADSFFILETKRGRFVVSIEGIKSENEVKHDIELLLFLRRHGFQCLQPLKSRGGQHYLHTDGRFISASRNIDGVEVPVGNLTLGQLAATGHVLADLHLIGRGYKKGVENRFSFPRVAALYQEVRKSLPAHLKTIVRVLDDEVNYLEGYLDNNLPKGIIHGNLSWESMKFKGSRLVGIMNFDRACRGKFICDLATTVNAVCYFEGRYRLDRFEELILGYEGLRPLSLPEWDSFPNELRFSALRTAITSLHDFYLRENGERQRIQKTFIDFFERLLILRREKDGGMEDLLLSMATGYDYRKYQKSKPSR